MASTLPPDLFDRTTLISLFSVLLILGAAYLVSRRVLSPATRPAYRFLFIWHAFDALIHFFFEGSFLYHCFFSSAPVASIPNAFPNPTNYLGHSDRFVHGAQAGGLNPFAQLWMVYAKADKRWAGVDLGVVSLELLTVLVVGPMAVWVCRDIAKGRQRVNITMIILATAELYGGFMTFCPEWLTGNLNLDTSNWMYMWLYLFFFNTIWVWIPLYAIYVASQEIMDAFRIRAQAAGVRKIK